MGRSASANKDARFSCSCEISMAKKSPYMGEQVFDQLDHFNFGVLAALTGKVLQDKETSVLVGRRSKEAQHPPGAFQELAYFILTKAPTRWVLLLPAFHGCGNRSSGRSQEPTSPDPGNPKGHVPAATVAHPQSGRRPSRCSARVSWSSQGGQEWMWSWGTQGRGPYPCRGSVKAHGFQHPLSPLDGAAVRDIEQRF